MCECGMCTVVYLCIFVVGICVFLCLCVCMHMLGVHLWGVCVCECVHACMHTVSVDMVRHLCDFPMMVLPVADSLALSLPNNGRFSLYLGYVIALDLVI